LPLGLMCGLKLKGVAPGFLPPLISSFFVVSFLSQFMFLPSSPFLWGLPFFAAVPNSLFVLLFQRPALHLSHLFPAGRAFPPDCLDIPVFAFGTIPRCSFFGAALGLFRYLPTALTKFCCLSSFPCQPSPFSDTLSSGLSFPPPLLGPSCLYLFFFS